MNKNKIKQNRKNMRKRLKRKENFLYLIFIVSMKAGGIKTRASWSKNVSVTVQNDKTKVYVIKT